LSLRVMERHPGCLSRSAISVRETGKYPFTEQELRDYLHACRATGDLIDYCLAQHRRIAQSLPAASPHASSSSAASTTVPVTAVSVASIALEIPDPDAEIKRLRDKAYSYEKSNALQSAVNAAAEAVTICETVYGLDHRTTLDARRQHLWLASKAFTESCKAGLFWSRRLRKEQENLRRSWETLIGSFQQVYGHGHIDTLQMRREYADCIRQTCFRLNGLGSYGLFRWIMVDVIAEASHSLGYKHEFTFRMRWDLTMSEYRIGHLGAWKKLAKQFEAELGPTHGMTIRAQRQAGLLPPRTYGN
jgi:hypothetical protein